MLLYILHIEDSLFTLNYFNLALQTPEKFKSHKDCAKKGEYKWVQTNLNKKMLDHF